MEADEKRMERIERELVRIRENTGRGWWYAAQLGLARGAGFVVGTVLALALAGWFLSLLGVIPGLGAITHRLNDIIQTR